MIIGEGTVTIGLVIMVFAVAPIAVGITIYVHRLIGAVRESISEHKLHVAETYMSKISGGAALDRAAAEIRSVGLDMKDDLAKLETVLMARIERMENRVFNGSANSR